MSDNKQQGVGMSKAAQRTMAIVAFLIFWWTWCIEAIGAMTGWYHLGVFS